MTHAPRFIFYANEIVGLGHLRRVLSIASRLSDADEQATSLVLSGSSIAPFFRLPRGVDTVKLPSRSRDGNGRQQPLQLSLGMDRLQDVRSSIALAVATSFAPHVAVIDKLPLGLGGELEHTLAALKARGSRLVLGLRDVEDSPARVRRRWGGDMREAIERFYDAILVYGPETALDAIDCMGWENLDVPVHHVGYLGQAANGNGVADVEPGYVLATVGGGRDGYQLLACLADALRTLQLDCPVVMVTGPLMPEEEVHTLRERTRGLDVTITGFRPDMDVLIGGARAVVSMAGYNTVAEIMRARKPALLVPRVRPSEEQLVRASALAAMGAQDMLHPDELTGPRMREALQRLLRRTAPDFPAEDYCGSERAAEIVARLAQGTAPGVFAAGGAEPYA